MRKAKAGRRKKPWIRRLLVACAAMLVGTLIVLFCLATFYFSIMSSVIRELHAPAPYLLPEKIETFTLSVNSDKPILTQHDYAGWVTVTINGTIDLGGGHYHDAERLCDAEGSCQPYTGLYINGRHLSGLPKRFSHDGYEFMFHYVGDSPGQIAFQLITEDYPEASGALEVEVFYPWHSFGRGGR